MKKKIGILTLQWANNYGALLQCYALQTYISSLGYDCKVINYISPEVKNEIRLLHFNLSVFKDIFFLKKHFLRNLRSVQFRKNFISFADTDDDCDILVVGSDQIWNLKITYNDKAYFGIGISKKKIPVISYAASMGQDLSAEYHDVFFANLQNVSQISVREESTKRYIQNTVEVDVEVVLDPVFLLPFKTWLKIIPENKIRKQSYIFVYAVDDAEGEFVKVVNQISEILNMDVICPGRSVHHGKNYNRIIKTFGTLGPDYFLYYMLHSDFVVTSSFHGTAFSLVLKKQFISVCPHLNAPRLIDLLSRLNCSDRLISSVEAVSAGLLSQKIDYSMLSKKINIEREKSAKWLMDALNDAD